MFDDEFGYLRSLTVRKRLELLDDFGRAHVRKSIPTKERSAIPSDLTTNSAAAGRINTKFARAVVAEPGVSEVEWSCSCEGGGLQSTRLPLQKILDHSLLAAARMTRI